METQNKQIKSKERIANHGEVFTNEREVNSMLDLVKRETERIDSRFLEPACGNGNFLIEILKRKLEISKQRSKNNIYEYKKLSIIAASSIYGVELLLDNAIECRNRLFNFASNFNSNNDILSDNNYLKSLKTVINLNIVCGDALTLKNNKGESLIFAEWGFIDDFVKRRDFKLATILEAEDTRSLAKDDGNQISLFSFEEANLDQYVENINKPIKEYDNVHFLKIGEEYGE